MTTKATRDVVDLKTRPIDVAEGGGLKVVGDCGTDFALDGIPIGQTTPCAGSFTDLEAINFGLTGDLDMNGFKAINAAAGVAAGDYVTVAQLTSAVGGGSVGNDFIAAGTIMVWSGATPPIGWLLCDGQSVDSVANPDFAELFTAIGTTYGGTGADNFNVPNLIGKVPVGLDTGSTVIPGATTLGATLGAAEITLTIAQLASHGHSGSGSVTSTGAASGTTTGGGAHSHTQNGSAFCVQGSGDNNVQACGSSTIGGGNHEHGFSLPAHSHGITVDVSDTGGDQAHPNIQPSMALNYIIKSIPGVIDQRLVEASGDIMDSGANLEFSGGGTVKGLPDAPASVNDAASGKYVDDQITAAIAGLNFDTVYVRLDGTNATMTGNINLNNNRITFVPTTPAATTDAVNSQYVLDQVKAGVSVTSNPVVISGPVAMLGTNSVLIVSTPVPSGGAGHVFADSNLSFNNAVAAIVYAKLWDPRPPVVPQISVVFEPALFLTEMWIPLWDGETGVTGDTVAQQFIVPIPVGGPLTWDVSAAGLLGDIWLVGYVKSIP